VLAVTVDVDALLQVNELMIASRIRSELELITAADIDHVSAHHEDDRLRTIVK
jgi:hypothetical protein